MPSDAMSRVPLLFHRQAGDVSCKRACNTVSHERLQSLDFSQDKLIRSVHTGGIACLDIDSVEQRYLLAGASDASIAVYDTQQASSAEAQQQQAQAREAAGARAAFGPGPALRQSQQMAAAAATVEHTEHAALFSITKQAPQGHKFSVTAVAWYPVDSGLFVSGGFDSEVKVWDTNSQQVVCNFALNSRVHATAMAPLATSHCLVAVGSDDTQVMLCDIVSGGFTHTLSGHRGAVWAVHWSLASEWQLVTGGCDGQLRLWDIRRSGPLHIFDEHDTREQHAQRQQQQQQQQQQDVQQQQQRQEKQQQAGGGSAVPERLQRQGSNSGKQRQRQGGDRRAGSSRGGSGTTATGGSAVVAAPAAGASSDRMFLPERTTRYSTAHGGSITGVVPTPDGLHWLSAGTDDRVRLWDAVTYRHALVNYPGAYNRATRTRQLAISDDSSVLFYPSGSVVQMYEVASGKTLRTLSGGHFESINCCRWNSAAQELYTGSNDCNIVVWGPARERASAERDDPEQSDSDADNWSN